VLCELAAGTHSASSCINPAYLAIGQHHRDHLHPSAAGSCHAAHAAAHASAHSAAHADAVAAIAGAILIAAIAIAIVACGHVRVGAAHKPQECAGYLMLYCATSGPNWATASQINQEDVLLLITIALVHAVAAAKLLLATVAVAAAAHAACPPAAEAALLLETLAAHPATGQ